jgi:hypothetical protein
MSDYSTPTIRDYGDLTALTADCFGGQGGDFRVPGGEIGGFSFGSSTSTCQSR